MKLLAIGGGKTKSITKLEPGESVIRWSGDGRYLYLRQRNGLSKLKITRMDVVTGRRQLWRELETPDPAGVQFGPVLLTPDGSGYAYSFQRDISTLYLAQGLK